MVPYYNLKFELIGNGLGSATRAGAVFGGYSWSENSWRRAFMEGGFFFGSAFILWRAWITKDLLKSCIQALNKTTTFPFFLFEQRVYFTLASLDNPQTLDLLHLVEGCVSLRMKTKRG